MGQPQALDEVRKRRALASSLEVTGQETDEVRRPQRFTRPYSQTAGAAPWRTASSRFGRPITPH